MKENSAVIRLASKLLGGLMADPSKGTRNQLWAATAKEVKSGEYYLPVGVSGKGSKSATDDELAEKLWKWTEDELKKWELNENQAYNL